MQQGTHALELEPRLDTSAVARRHVLSRLLAWGLDDLVDPVLLLTSEVVTNAVLHSGTRLEVTVARDGVGVRVEVADGSSAPPVQRQHSTSASTGRGVQLLEAMADEWGWTATSTGKLVWFRVLTDNGWALDRELEGQAGL